jgi:hypothetical protein
MVYIPPWSPLIHTMRIKSFADQFPEHPPYKPLTNSQKATAEFLMISEERYRERYIPESEWYEEETFDCNRDVGNYLPFINPDKKTKKEEGGGL